MARLPVVCLAAVAACAGCAMSFEPAPVGVVEDGGEPSAEPDAGSELLDAAVIEDDAGISPGAPDAGRDAGRDAAADAGRRPRPDSGAIAPDTGPAALTLGAGDWELDTESATLVAPNGAATMLAANIGSTRTTISVPGLAIGSGATLRVIGGRALELSVLGSASIEGTIIVRAGARSAGDCPTGAGEEGRAATDPQSGGGGGGGGGFGANGGDGGDGGGEDRGGKGRKGEDNSAAILGGCPGGQGSGGAAGGQGGGAISIVVRDTITIAGRIDAGGDGGGGGAPGASDEAGGEGGGGGGSGGAIAIEAATLNVASAARLCANGGSGGNGGYGSAAGESGSRASCDFIGATSARSGRMGIGGDGGSRAHREGRNGQRGEEDDGEGGGGGGGGGGVGRIRLIAPGGPTIALGAMISPEEQP